jgi:hypothetical protein
MFCANVWVGSITVTRTQIRGSYQYVINGEIYVENQSHNKLVGIHYEVGGNWHDLTAHYSHSLLTAGGNRIEVWTVNDSFYSSSMNSTVRLAAYYHNLDLGVSCWDNNGGGDYTVPI